MTSRMTPQTWSVRELLGYLCCSQEAEVWARELVVALFRTVDSRAMLSLHL